MGYTTEFSGELKFKNEITIPQLKELQKWFGKECPSASYVQFELTEEMDGIKWDGGEKFYQVPECVNWLTEHMREQWPDFAFTGELKARGEEFDDRWRLVIDETGFASKQPVSIDGKKVKCPHCREEFYIDKSGKVME